MRFYLMFRLTSGIMMVRHGRHGNQPFELADGSRVAGHFKNYLPQHQLSFFRVKESFWEVRRRLGGVFRIQQESPSLLFKELHYLISMLLSECNGR